MKVAASCACSPAARVSKLSVAKILTAVAPRVLRIVAQPAVIVAFPPSSRCNRKVLCASHSACTLRSLAGRGTPCQWAQGIRSVNPQDPQQSAQRRGGRCLMRTYLIGLTWAVVLGASSAAVAAEGVPKLDHVFVIVLENHNAFTSFGANGILDNPKAPHIQALAKTYNFAANYNGAWHLSLPNYVAMITGDFIGTDVVATRHSY